MKVACILLIALTALLAPLASAEIAQEGDLRVAFKGEIAPRKLPRQGSAPISVSMSGAISTLDGSAPPALTSFQVALNRAGTLDTGGLPKCSLNQIQPSSTVGAERACRDSLVGEGSFAASVAIPEQSPFPSEGKLLAFNGTQKGKPVIFAHVYGTEPIPTSFTLPLKIASSKGTFGTVLTGSLPKVSSNIAFVTAISLKLGRSFRVGGETRGYISSACPAPEGFNAAPFPLARTSFAFADGRTLTSVLNRSCRVRRVRSEGK